MNVTTLKDTLVARRLALNPWTGFYFLQSLLINLALGYEFSLLYTVAFTCVLHLLWRAFPRVQKAVVGAYSLLAALYYPLSLIHISEPTRLGMISYAVFCLKKKK